MTGLSGISYKLTVLVIFLPPADNFVLSLSYCVLSFSLQGLREQ